MSYYSKQESISQNNAKIDISMPSLPDNETLVQHTQELTDQSDSKYGDPAVDEQNVSSSDTEETSAHPVSSVSRPTKSEVVEKNIAAMRVATRKAESERDEAFRLLKEMQNSRESRSDSVKDDSDLELGNDDLAEGKHIKRVSSKVSKIADDLAQMRKESEDIRMERRLLDEMPDIYKVLSEENIFLLNEHEPEMAEAIRSNTNLYTKSKAAYRAIKNMGIYKEDPYSLDKSQAHKNALKPRPMASVAPQQGDSPLSKANAFANGLTKDLQTQLLKEMEHARKNR